MMKIEEILEKFSSLELSTENAISEVLCLLDVSGNEASPCDHPHEALIKDKPKKRQRRKRKQLPKVNLQHLV